MITAPMQCPAQTASEARIPPESQPSPLDEMERFVDGPRLLAILWDEASRPSLRWLRTQQKRRAIPFVRIGHRVWFIPSQVRQHLAEWQTIKQQRSLRRPPFHPQKPRSP